MDNTNNTVGTKTKIITPGGCIKNSIPTRKQKRPTKYLNKCMCVSLTPFAQTNVEIVKKHSTKSTTKNNRVLSAIETKKINLQSKKKRVPILYENNIPPTKSTSSTITTKQSKPITPRGDPD